MSADTSICILKTKDEFKISKNGELNFSYNKKVTAWRVAVVQAVENISYYQKKELHNLGWYLAETFNKAKPFYNKREAEKYADHLLYDVYKGDIEYGVVEYDLSEYNFPEINPY